MLNQIPPPQSTFDTVLQTSVTKFGEVAAKIINAMLSCQFTLQKTEVLHQGLSVEQKFFVSILFTGTIYGEYILAMDEKTATLILGKNINEVSFSQTRTEISETFCELLNVVVGESILAVGDQYKKLTITSPRVYFGKINYPKIKTGRAVLLSEKGQIDCYLYIDRMKLDITASYKDALASLLKAHKELLTAMNTLKEQQSFLVQSEKMAALGTMAAGVAHEINTPLAAVAIIGEQLKEMFQDKSINKIECIEMLEMIEQTVLKIARITNSLKIFARGIGGEFFTLVPLKEIIENTVVLSEQSLQDKGIKLLCEFPPHALTLECRQSQISQVLLNIINNACDAIETQVEKWVKIKVTDSSDFIEIRVSDSGSGISKEVQLRIFDPFFTTKGFGKGTGLGLSIAKGIVEDHLGTIALDPNSVQTCFIIKLPRQHKEKELLCKHQV